MLEATWADNLTLPTTLTVQALHEQAVRPFVDRARSDRPSGPECFSLLEHGSWHGLHSLALSSAFPRSTLVALEPDEAAWRRHAKLARSLRRRNVFVAHNPLSDEMAEALARSNEFFDGQLLLSLHTCKSFDHGFEVRPSLVDRLDKFVGRMLSLARRSLVLLPSDPSPQCADNRLANWVRAPARGAAGSAAAGGTDETVAARLAVAGESVGLKLRTSRVLSGRATDGCEYGVWEVRLQRMSRTNQHHFCLGGCKTHTRRTYQMVYTASATSSLMNMTNTQTSRRIPFETGSINLHSLLSLHRLGRAPDGAATLVPPAADAERQLLMVMYLALPVFQDPAPWNIVWRAGELLPTQRDRERNAA